MKWLVLIVSLLIVSCSAFIYWHRSEQPSVTLLTVNAERQLQFWHERQLVQSIQLAQQSGEPQFVTTEEVTFLYWPGGKTYYEIAVDRYEVKAKRATAPLVAIAANGVMLLADGTYFAGQQREVGNGIEGIASSEERLYFASFTKGKLYVVSDRDYERIKTIRFPRARHYESFHVFAGDVYLVADGQLWQRQAEWRRLPYDDVVAVHESDETLYVETNRVGIYALTALGGDEPLIRLANPPTIVQGIGRELFVMSERNVLHFNEEAQRWLEPLRLPYLPLAFVFIR